ncbi:MAG: hypothetical protein ACD_10C00116G0002 [uncultured bacterium]|nr:MAG: hypothetical protein ACD_10C00116G0002 [uncultured bacterium]
MIWPMRGRKFEAGWMAVVRRGACLDLAHVIIAPEKRPEIRLLESFSTAGSDDDALLRLAQAKGLKRFRCTTLLGENDYYLAQMEALGVPLEERLQALRWRLKDAVEFPVETAAVAATDIPNQAGRQGSVFVAAASSALVGEKMGQFERAKIRLEAIDIPEMAIRNVAALFEEPNRGLAFLALCDGDSLLTITYQGELCLARRIEMSGESLAQDDAERRQQTRERLALELQRTLDNFDRQYGFISVSRLLVATEFDCAGLVAALGENLYIKVEVMDLAQVADFSGLPELRLVERQAQCLLAIGAAMRTAA